MPNTVDTVKAFKTILQSGIVVSGNVFITVNTQIVSGDATTSLYLSGVGRNESILIRKAQILNPKTMTGGKFTSLTDVIETTIFSRISGFAYTNVVQRAQDLKITIASGNWHSGYNLALPVIYDEVWPLNTADVAKVAIKYKVSYAL